MRQIWNWRLRAEKVGKYITDFPNEAVLKMKKIQFQFRILVLLQQNQRKNCAIMAARQVKEFLETGNIKKTQ
ncbi:hypothetical protein GCM10020331_074470 [Ectobacillus funiculus]